MTMTPEQATAFQEAFGRMVAGVEQVLLGKTFVVRLGFVALLSEGHLLLEDFPGTGKTSFARAIAQTVAGSTSRIQFTPDLLPGDITGVSIYDQRTGAFDFHRGPVFANIVLADEINRASPKTQAALLEVMEEGHVTVDGETHDVGLPFMVIATQNPIEQAGTYRLPEAQLDRFLLKASIGYPDHASTLRILDGAGVKAHDVTIPPVVTADAVLEMAQLARTVHVDPSVNDYVSRLVDATRSATEVRLGVSVRGALALVRSAKTLAAASGRHYVVPDDVKSLAEPVLAHRLVLDPEAEFDGVTAVEHHRPAAARDPAAERSASRVTTARTRSARVPRHRVAARDDTQTRDDRRGSHQHAHPPRRRAHGRARRHRRRCSCGWGASSGRRSRAGSRRVAAVVTPLGWVMLGAHPGRAHRRLPARLDRARRRRAGRASCSSSSPAST